MICDNGPKIIPPSLLKARILKWFPPECESTLKMSVPLHVLAWIWRALPGLQTFRYLFEDSGERGLQMTAGQQKIQNISTDDKTTSINSPLQHQGIQLQSGAFDTQT